MRRVGIDDGRLFSLRGKPFVLFAGVAPALQEWLTKEGAMIMSPDVHAREDYPCQHRQYLCPLKMPDEASENLKELKARRAPHYILKGANPVCCKQRACPQVVDGTFSELFRGRVPAEGAADLRPWA